jgi:hypothetical protein
MFMTPMRKAALVATLVSAVGGGTYYQLSAPNVVASLPASTSLKTHDGKHYVSAWPDGFIEANRPWEQTWEEFTIERHADRVAFKTHHGFYCAAEPDFTVNCNRAEAQEWELWWPERSGTGYGFRSTWQKFLVAEGGGGGELKADRAALGPWETFTVRNGSPAPGPIDGGATGRLRLEGNQFVDDSGPVLPLYAHAGNLFSLYTRDPARALKELDDVAAAGYRGVRTWSTLGCRGGPCNGSGFWAGREVGPGLTPEFWQKLSVFASELRARGLRAVWSQGDVAGLSYNGSTRRGYMERLAALDNEKPFIDFLDCGNEAWQTGEPDPAKLAECVGYYKNAGGKALLSLSSPPSEDGRDLDAWSIPPANVYDVHSFRDNHSWDKRRHIFSTGYEANTRLKNGIQSEPAGNGALVSAIANREELDNEAVPLLAAASFIGRQAFVWFSGEGVIINQGLNVEAGFYTTPKTVAMLPKDLMSYETIHHGGDRWRGTRVLAATGEGRADCRTASDGRFACTLDGPPGTYRWPVERSFEGKLCNPDGGCQDVAATKGARLDTTFTRGRLLVGKVH